MKSKVKFNHLPNTFLLQLIKIEPNIGLTCKELFDIGKAVRYAALIGPGHMTNNSISAKPANFSQIAKFVRFLSEFCHYEYANKVKTLSLPYQTATDNAKDLYEEMNKSIKRFKLENIVFNQPPHDELWDFIPIKRGIKSITIYSQDESIPIEDLVKICLSKLPTIKNLRLHFLQDDIRKFSKIDDFEPTQNTRINSIETLTLRAIQVGHKHSSKKHPQLKHQLKDVSENVAKFDEHLEATRMFRFGSEIVIDGDKTLMLGRVYEIDPPSYEHSSATRLFSTSQPAYKFGLRNHKGAAARWKAIGNNQFTRKKAGRNHKNYHLSPEQTNRLANGALAHGTHKQRLSRLLPNV
ncbi:hypothetical protein E3P77_03914 [Wallemia ichthyophaga]|nr:hypothetical protein E3P77_03914 [Wallemia ichthyophaga]